MINFSLVYLQECMFGNAQKVEIKPEYRPTQEEINEYYKTHTLLEAVRHFHCRPSKLNIDPALKKGRRGAGINSFETEVQVVFLKTFTSTSDRALAKQFNLNSTTIAEIVRRNRPLKNLFEEYMKQLGNAYGEYLLKNIEPMMQGMDNILAEALSKKKIKAADFKELIDGWAKMHSNIIEYIPRESAAPSGDVDAKAQLMSAITAAIKAPEMDKQTAESIYYQPEEDEKSILSDEQEMNDETT